MTLHEILKVINTISGEKLKGKVLTPEQYQIIIKQASLKHFKKKVGLPEEYQPGAPLPRQAYEITNLITMYLSPFKVQMGKTGSVPMRVDSNGFADSPTNMYYPGTMQYNSSAGIENIRRIDIVSDQEWVDRHEDALQVPTWRNPIANIQNGYIRFSPITDKFVEFVYLKYPADPVYAYTQNEGYVEYDSINSTELEWDEVNQIDIIYIILFDLGINIGKPEVMAIADKVKTEGV